MDPFLIVARAVHLAGTISLAGVFVFECFIAVPVLTRAGTVAPVRFARQLAWLVRMSLALALVSGAAWLLAVASDMGGQPLGTALMNGTWQIVATRTQFGQAWLVRLGCAIAIAICLVGWRGSGATAAARWAALLLAVPVLAGIAWGGHGAATPGTAGKLHLAGDILHLLGAGGWLGTLLPFALLLIEAKRGGDPPGPTIARHAARRFSVLAFISVALLLFGGIVNTWFLAGTIPALVGTGYGKLLLAKIALFLGTLVIAAVNLLRLSPRLVAAGTGAGGRMLVWMRRNALAEAGLGLAVLAIVAVLGTLPPGLHSEPGWPFPYRVDFAALSVLATIALALLLATAGAAAIAAVALAAAGRYRSMAGIAAAGIAAIVAVWLPLRPGIEPAYPTSFYAPAEPYSAPSIVAGAALYTADCAMCHGASGRGDGPAAAGMTTRPADLTAPHLLAHSPGDLFWWVSNGKGNGAMPGFAAILQPNQRWDAINFVRARAAGVLARGIGPHIAANAASAVPDFAYVSDGAQRTLSRSLVHGPVLLILFAPPAPTARLAALAAAKAGLAAAGLSVIAVATGAAEEEAKIAAPAPFVVTAAPAVEATLGLFRGPNDGAETDLLLDRGGIVRARWVTNTRTKLPDAAALAAEAKEAAEIAVAGPSHAGHGQ